MLEDLFNVVSARISFAADDHGKERTKKVNIPKDLLFKCPRCSGVCMTEELESNMRVCPACGYHSRIDFRQRLSITVDKDILRNSANGDETVVKYGEKIGCADR